MNLLELPTYLNPIIMVINLVLVIKLMEKVIRIDRNCRRYRMRLEQIAATTACPATHQATIQTLKEIKE